MVLKTRRSSRANFSSQKSRSKKSSKCIKRKSRCVKKSTRKRRSRKVTKKRRSPRKRKFKMAKKLAERAGWGIAAGGLSYIGFKLAEQNYKNLQEYLDERGREWYYFWTANEEILYAISDYFVRVEPTLWRHGESHTAAKVRYKFGRTPPWQPTVTDKFKYGFWKLKLKKDEFEKLKRLLAGQRTEILKNLPDIPLTKEKCPICLEHLAENIETTKCNHKFHRECINRWREGKSTCPICRGKIDVEGSISPSSKTLKWVVKLASNNESWRQSNISEEPHASRENSYIVIPMEEYRNLEAMKMEQDSQAGGASKSSSFRYRTKSRRRKKKIKKKPRKRCLKRKSRRKVKKSRKFSMYANDERTIQESFDRIQTLQIDFYKAIKAENIEQLANIMDMLKLLIRLVKLQLLTKNWIDEEEWKDSLSTKAQQQLIEIDEINGTMKKRFKEIEQAVRQQRIKGSEISLVPMDLETRIEKAATIVRQILEGEGFAENFLIKKIEKAKNNLKEKLKKQSKEELSRLTVVNLVNDLDKELNRV